MAQLADPATGLSGWIDYLTTPTPAAAEQPTAQRFVLAAVLADETIVKIDENARWYPGARVYRSTGAKVELTEAMRGADAVFTTDSGLYRVLTPDQYAEMKRVEAARAEAVANAAVTSPRATRAPSPKPPGEAMARLSVAPTPAPTGCGAHARMVTMVAVGPSHIGAALRHAAPLMERARKLNNEVVVVVVGVADENEAEEALRLSGNSVLLAGARELAVLKRGRQATGPMRAYLREAVLLECVAGMAGEMDAEGRGGAWLLPEAPVPLDGSRAPLAPRANASMRAWKDALNAQWRDWRARFYAGELGADDRELLAVYTSFPAGPDADEPPLNPFARDAVGLVGLGAPPPFGVVDCTVAWRGARRDGGGWPEPRARWASPGGGPASVYWAIATWCGRIRALLDQTAPRLDLHTSASELQWEFEQTLLSLLTYTAGDFSQPFLKRFDDLKGVLGPVVLGGRNDAQPMRATWWTLADRAGGVLMLVPEAYVQHATVGYHAHAPPMHDGALLCAQGYLVLHDDDALPITLSGVKAEELEAERRAFGRRLWIPNGATAYDSHAAVAALDGHAAAARDAAPPPTFRTQREAMALESAVSPGARVPGTPGRTVWNTSETSSHALSGLRVCLVRRAARPHMPTLDVDTYEGGLQLAFESV